MFFCSFVQLYAKIYKNAQLWLQEIAVVYIYFDKNVLLDKCKPKAVLTLKGISGININRCKGGAYTVEHVPIEKIHHSQSQFMHYMVLYILYIV